MVTQLHKKAYKLKLEIVHIETGIYNKHARTGDIKSTMAMCLANSQRSLNFWVRAMLSKKGVGIGEGLMAV